MMSPSQAIGAILLAVVPFGPGQAGALGVRDATRTSFEVPRQAVLMGQDIGLSEWPMRLASPSAEGQFEVLVKKGAAPVYSPRCRSRYLVVRMPASLGDGMTVRAEIERKTEQYARMLSAYNAGQSIRFDVFAGPYGRRLPDGRIRISGCNIFFVEPQPITR